MVVDGIKRRVPTSWKRGLRRTKESARRQVRRPFKESELRAALSELAHTAPTPPSDELLRRLVSGWDNPAAGDLEYLRAVVDLARTAEGPILECGSGLTTFLLAAYATQPVWTLEGDERWYRRVVKESELAGLTGVTVALEPLQDYGDFHWYGVPSGLPASISLVVCDGPAAGGLKGGRVGLFPLLGNRIESGAPVVVDRGMVYENDAVAIWQSDYGLLATDTATEHRVYLTP